MSKDWTSEDVPKLTCPVCGKEFHREDMDFTRDCHASLSGWCVSTAMIKSWGKAMTVLIIPKQTNVSRRTIEHE